MVEPYSNRVNLAIGLCEVARVQHHIKTSFANTFDGVSLSDESHPFTTAASGVTVRST